MEQADRAVATILVDNIALVDDAYTEYGLSLHVRVEARNREFNILFDTSGSPWALLHNAKLLGIDPARIDYVVISHMHRDHYYALKSLWGLLRPKLVYLPEPVGVSSRVSEILETGRVERTSLVKNRAVIAPGVEVFGPVASSGEVSMIVETRGARMLLVACGHAPMRHVLYWSRRDSFDVVMGGFHLKNGGRRRIEEVYEALRDKAAWVVGLHCTHWGSWLLRPLLGSRFIEGGVGLRICLSSSSLHFYPQPSL